MWETTSFFLTRKMFILVNSCIKFLISKKYVNKQKHWYLIILVLNRAWMVTGNCAYSSFNYWNIKRKIFCIILISRTIVETKFNFRPEVRDQLNNFRGQLRRNPEELVNPNPESPSAPVPEYIPAPEPGLRQVSEIPEPGRILFSSLSSFNKVQSEVLDDVFYSDRGVFSSK